MRTRRGAMALAVVLALFVWLAALTMPVAGPAAPPAPTTAAAAPTSMTAAVGRAPTPAAPGGEPAIPDLAPRAASAVLMDAASGKVIWSKNANDPRQAASITKLMTIDVR